MERNVPKLRFKKFDSKWEKKHLSNIVERVVRKNKDNRTQRPLTISAQYGLVDQEEFFNKIVASKNLEGYYLLEKGEFAYNKSYSNGYPFGTIKRLDRYDSGAVSTLYICFNNKENFNSDYLVQYFESSKWHREVSMIAVEGARNHGLLNVSVPDFFDTIHRVPSLQEQERIASFLTKVDKIIEKQDEKVKNLEKYKKGMMQKIFSQEIRFKDENGEEYPGWNKEHLGNLVERVVRKNKGNISNRPLTISAQYGLVDQKEFFNKVVASSNLEGYYLLENGEFAYNKSYSNGYPFGAIKRLDKYDNGAVSTLYICFKPKNGLSSDFLCHYFESDMWHKEVAMVAVEGARNHGLLNISVGDFFDTLHKVPCKKEQIQIANFLNNISNLLYKEENKFKELQKWKKALLQQMFV